MKLWIIVLLVVCNAISIGKGTVNSGSLSFLVIGDWGGQDDSPYTTRAEVYTAKYMGEVAEEIGSRFTIALGDNFYEDGVKDVDDKRFKETFEVIVEPLFNEHIVCPSLTHYTVGHHYNGHLGTSKLAYKGVLYLGDVFTADSLQTKWFPICGNHDYHGNCSAEIAYTKYSKRWYFPDFYYTQIYAIPGTSKTVQILFLDTIILTGISDPIDRSAPLDGPMSIADAEKEWNWIEDTLNSSNADWLIVCGHYPVWSAGKHGPTKALVDRLRPILQKYNVSLYISGHDHDLQYIYEKGYSVHYLVSGAGHEIEKDKDHQDDIPKDSLLFWHAPHSDDSHGGFNSITITPSQMTINFYTAKAKNVYSTVIMREI